MLYESTYYGVTGLGDDSLQHHGIKGQKWGVRRYQNPDGTLTAAGKHRYGTVENFNRARQQRRERAKKIAKGVAIGAAAAAGAYGAYRLGKHLSSDEKAYASALASRLPDGRHIIEEVAHVGGPNKSTVDTAKQKLAEAATKRIEAPRDTEKFIKPMDQYANGEKIRNRLIETFNTRDMFGSPDIKSANVRFDLLKNIEKTLDRDRKSLNYDSYDSQSRASNRAVIERVLKTAIGPDGKSNERIDALLNAYKRSLDEDRADLRGYVNRTKAQMSSIQSRLPKGMNLSELSMDDLRKLDLY